MPRVHTARKNRAGKARSCGRCGQQIKPGETYRSWSFRYGGTHYRCFRPACTPRQSELTQSKLGEVYAAVENAEDNLGDIETHSDAEGAVEAVAETVRQVADEYREADEAFGGQGATESAERADELEGWADELEGWTPSGDDPAEFVPSAEPADEDDTSAEDEKEELLEALRAEVQDVLGGCPL